jgi:hypothetical protein
MRKIKITFIFFCLFFLHGKAGSDTNPVYSLMNHALSVGIGSMHEYDSYLSPLLYKGSGFTLMSERLKYFKPDFDKLSWFSEAVFQIGTTENPARNTNMFPLYFKYFIGVHYHWRPVKNLNLLGGSLLNMELGGRFQMANQNNPFSLSLNTNLWLSTMAYYHIPLRKRTLTIRNHFAMPFIGSMFSPHYTQTYYEIFGLGHTDGVITYSSFHKRMAWRNKLSLDIPVSCFTFRTGFLAERTVTKVNHLETRTTNLSFLVGFVYSFNSFKGNKEIPSEFKNPTH